MQQPEKRKKDELTFAQKIEQFIILYRKPILISVSVLVFGLIILGVVTTVQSRRIVEYTERVERVETRFNEYLSADAEGRPEISAQIQEELQAIISGNGKNYPALRALMISGELAFQEERFGDAKDYFLKAADQFPRTYLAPVALMNAAVSSEKIGEQPKAVEYYQRVVDSYADSFQGASRALLNIGRLYEAMGDANAAAFAYEQLTADYSDSEWAKLAQTRLIQLEIGM